MDDSTKKPKDQPASPPPDPRGTSEPVSSLGEEFDPGVVDIENHEAVLDEDGKAKGALTGAGLTAAAPEMQINKPESRLKRVIKNKKLWLTLVFVLIATAVALWFIQGTRAWVVNAIGLRVSVTVSTRTTAEPGSPSAVLQKAKVNLNGVESESGDTGEAKFSAKYGQVTVSAEKSGYESAEQADTYDFDPFFGLFGKTGSAYEERVELQLKSVGLPLSFKVVNWLSEQPVTSGDFKVGDVIAKPDEQGIVSLKVAPTDAASVQVSAKFSGDYVNKDFELPLNAQTLTQEQVAIVPSGKNYFISNRTGQLGIYSSDLDGSNVQQLVAPSANETAAIDFSASPSGKYGVLASSREGKQGSNNLLQKLYVVNLTSGTLYSVDEGLWFDFVDWSGDTLVYKTASSHTAQRLASVDASNNKKVDLGSAASYGQVVVGLGKAVYLLSNTEASDGPELRVVPVAGGTEKNLGNKVQSLTQGDHDKVVFRADNTWREYNLNTETAGNSSAPTSTSRVFLASTSADGQSRLLFDTSDGASTLLVKNVATGAEQKLYQAPGLTKTVRWLGNFVVFGLKDATQTANYVVATGYNPKKIGDVTISASPQSSDYFSFN